MAPQYYQLLTFLSTSSELDLITRNAIRAIAGSGLAFCLSQKSHTNALKYQCTDENDIDISYPRYKILPRSSPFCKKSWIVHNIMH